jgi:excisionase family DNA binding protein
VTQPVADEWLSLTEAAELLGVHPTTLRMWADKGDLPTHRTPGKHRRFRRADIETWGAARREAQTSPGQLIIQHAMGRVRMQMAEGELNKTAWYPRLDELRRREFRDSSRQLLGALMRYLGPDGQDPALLEEAKQIGQSYDRMGRAAGLSLSEKVSVFFYFRDFLYDSVIDVYQASGQRAAREWAHFHRRITSFTNAILVALIEAHEVSGK